SLISALSLHDALPIFLIGLLELLRRALLAHRVMNAVMAEHGRHASRRWAWWVRPLLFPFPWRPRSVKRTGPLFYGGHSRQRLDVDRKSTRLNSSHVSI